MTAGVAAPCAGPAGLPWHVRAGFVVAAPTNLPVRRVHATAAGPHHPLPGQRLARLVLDATKPAVSVTTSSGPDRRWLPVDTLTGPLDGLHPVVTGAKPAQATMDDTPRTATVLDAH